MFRRKVHGVSDAGSLQILRVLERERDDAVLAAKKERSRRLTAENDLVSLSKRQRLPFDVEGIIGRADAARWELRHKRGLHGGPVPGDRVPDVEFQRCFHALGELVELARKQGSR